MVGIVANLDEICAFEAKYDSLVMIDECHATGFIGEPGRGTLALKPGSGRIDIITGTLGKLWEGLWVVTLLVKRKLLKFYVKDQDPIYFQIL